jgi:hypothetical protein
MTTRLQDIKQRISNTLDTIDGMITNPEGGDTTFLDQIIAYLTELGIIPSTPRGDNLMPEEGDIFSEDGDPFDEEGDLPGERGKNPEDTGLGVEGEVVEKVDPLEQIRSDMALLKSHIAGLPSQDVINKLQAQVVMLPGKDEIVSAVLGKIPEPTCSCQQSIGADNLDLGLGDPRRDGNVE